LHKLREIVATNPDIAFIYIMRRDGDQVRFVVDSDSTPAVPGEIYPEKVNELLEGFIRPAVDRKIYTDKWGSFLSGYSPLENSRGKFLIGIDMRADDVKRKFLYIRLAGLFSLLLSLVLAIGFSLFLARHFTGKINALINRCSEIADENLHQTIRPILSPTEDELDLLTLAFDRMANNLAASRRQNLEAQQKLVAANENLEHRINERTENLKQANQELRAEIQRREQAEQELKLTARTDYLTSLLNRRAMIQRLEQEISRFRRKAICFSALMLDIDHFKEINDTYGHPTGDRLLIEMAALFQAGIRDTDEIARWGGEEFLILFPETDLAQALELALRLKQKLADHHFRARNQKISITASFGVSEFREELQLETFLQQIDACLYKAKTAGRNQICTPADMDSSKLLSSPMPESA
ncbi:MAG: diguanylate cyclase, partial [Deltaproteobacteria bacterium]|nr:diguanylate cyclase [Deltaproteobacteria bacterium]